jgi:hypothetical protein
LPPKRSLGNHEPASSTPRDNATDSYEQEAENGKPHAGAGYLPAAHHCKADQIERQAVRM